jgi:hypothetical protein
MPDSGSWLADRLASLVPATAPLIPITTAQAHVCSPKIVGSFCSSRNRCTRCGPYNSGSNTFLSMSSCGQFFAVCIGNCC